MRLRTVHSDGDVGFDTDISHLSKTFLVVGTSSSNPDGHLVSDQLFGVGSDGSDDASEGSSDVCEVGDTATDDERLSILEGLTSSHELQDGLGVLVGFALRRGTRVLTVVGEFVTEAHVGDGIGVDDGSTATGDHGPDLACGVQDGELEGSACSGVEVLDVSFLGHFGTTERAWEVNVAPLSVVDERCGFVDLGGHVERDDLVVAQHNERVDFEVDEVQFLEE